MVMYENLLIDYDVQFRNCYNHSFWERGQLY